MSIIGLNPRFTERSRVRFTRSRVFLARLNLGRNGLMIRRSIARSRPAVNSPAQNPPQPPARFAGHRPKVPYAPGRPGKAIFGGRN